MLTLPLVAAPKNNTAATVASDICVERSKPWDVLSGVTIRYLSQCRASPGEISRVLMEHVNAVYEPANLSVALNHLSSQTVILFFEPLYDLLRKHST